MPRICCIIAGILLLQTNCLQINGGTDQNFTTPRHENDWRFLRGYDDHVDVKSKSNRRTSRGFQFQASEYDLHVSLEFIVPIVHIPVVRSNDLVLTSLRSLMDLNGNALLTSGAIAGAGAAVAAVVKTLTSMGAQGRGDPIHYRSFGSGGRKKHSRSDDMLEENEQPLVSKMYKEVHDDIDIGSSTEKGDNVSSLITDLMSSLEASLHAHGINVTTCAQKIICDYVRQSIDDVKNRLQHSSDWTIIIDGLSSVDDLRQYLDGTALQRAMDAGRGNQSCDHVFRSCQWSQSMLTILRLLIKYLP